mmetsp:Transcript_28477/g.37237  ORF Transcript_28477/g.37237 Transcript_28477/m.37237 type:complete len:553 (-) Transcript_28477:313-1971(-)
MNNRFPFGRALYLLVSILNEALGAYEVTQVHILQVPGPHVYAPNDREATLALSEDGVEQMWEVGAEVRDRYFCGNGESHLAALNGAYGENANDFYSMSSASERSMMSAAAFNKGLWSGCSVSTPNFNQMISEVSPVHSVPGVNDITLQAYKTCPAYLEEVEEFYGSETFLEKLETDSGLLNTVQECFKDEFLSAFLAGEGWHVNFFDSSGAHIFDGGVIAAALEEVGPALILKRMPLIYDYARSLQISGQLYTVIDSDSCTYTDELDSFVVILYELAGWVEHKKSFLSNAPKYLASNFLREVKQHIATRLGEELLANTTSTTSFAQHTNTYFDVIHYTSSYETMLGVFRALGLGKNSEVEEIPSFGSLLAFELKENLDDPTAVKYIDIYFKDGFDSSFSTMNMQHVFDVYGGDFAMDGPDHSVEYETFFRFIKLRTYSSAFKWCSECGNIASATCLGTEYNTLLAEKLAEEELRISIATLEKELQEEKDKTAKLIAGISIPSFVVGILGYLLVSRLATRWMKQADGSGHLERQDGAAKQGQAAEDGGTEYVV